MMHGAYNVKKHMKFSKAWLNIWNLTEIHVWMVELFQRLKMSE